MGMGSRQPMRGQNEAFGRNQINPRGMGFMPASQPRMSGGKGGYNPSGPIRFDPNAGQEPVDPRFGVDLGPIDPDDIDTRTSEELNQPIDNFDPPLEDPVMEDPAPAPEPYVPYARPRPPSGLFSDQSGIASLRGQYRAPSMSNPQFRPYRPVQRYQPPQRMPRPPYGQRPPSGPSKGGRPPAQPPRRVPPLGGHHAFMPSPRMPSPYGRPPMSGPSKGGRMPSGPTKGGRPMPQIPFNPPSGG